MRVEEAMENTGMVLEEFKPAQRKVIFEAADADLNLDHYLNPKFSASHMKFHHGTGNGREGCYMASYRKNPSQEHC